MAGVWVNHEVQGKQLFYNLKTNESQYEEPTVGQIITPSQPGEPPSDVYLEAEAEQTAPSGDQAAAQSEVNEGSDNESGSGDDKPEGLLDPQAQKTSISLKLKKPTGSIFGKAFAKKLVKSQASVKLNKRKAPQDNNSSKRQQVPQEGAQLEDSYLNMVEEYNNTQGDEGGGGKWLVR